MCETHWRPEEATRLDLQKPIEINSHCWVCIHFWWIPFSHFMPSFLFLQYKEMVAAAKDLTNAPPLLLIWVEYRSRVYSRVTLPPELLLLWRLLHTLMYKIGGGDRSQHAELTTFFRKDENRKRKLIKSEWHQGVNAPASVKSRHGALKLDHFQPVRMILFQNVDETQGFMYLGHSNWPISSLLSWFCSKIFPPF